MRSSYIYLKKEGGVSKNKKKTPKGLRKNKLGWGRLTTCNSTEKRKKGEREPTVPPEAWRGLTPMVQT